MATSCPSSISPTTSALTGYCTIAPLRATRLYAARRRQAFHDTELQVFGSNSFKGMGVDFGDVMGDGRLAIYVSNIADTFALEESHFLWVETGNARREMKAGIAPFDDESEGLGLSRSGWGWDCKLDDFDNSGHLQMIQATGFLAGRINRWPELQELAMGNDELLQYPGAWPRFKPGDALSDHDHTPFFVRDRRGIFFDMARQIGFEPADRGYVSRGIAIADVFGNGKLDFVLANQWADLDLLSQQLAEPISVSRSAHPLSGRAGRLNACVPGPSDCSAAQPAGDRRHGCFDITRRWQADCYCRWG